MLESDSEDNSLKDTEPGANNSGSYTGEEPITSHTSAQGSETG